LLDALVDLAEDIEGTVVPEGRSMIGIARPRDAAHALR
jgi:hypothetical protein